MPHFPNCRLMWKVCGLPAVFQATFTRTLLCTRFNRSPIARAFGLTCIRIQGLVMLLFYTACLPSSFGSFGANNPTRTDNRLITNQLRYRLRHISILKGIAYHPSMRDAAGLLSPLALCSVTTVIRRNGQCAMMLFTECKHQYTLPNRRSRTSTNALHSVRIGGTSGRHTLNIIY